jgi:hypothetical protein
LGGNTPACGGLTRHHAIREVLRAIRASARLKKNKGEGERFKQHAALLEECRSEGIETAFAKLSGSKMYITTHELLGGNEGKNNTAVRSGDEIAQLKIPAPYSVSLARRPLGYSEAC